MTGLEFNRNQRLVLYALIGLSAIGLSYQRARNWVGRTDEVVIREPGERGGVKVEATDSDLMPGDRGSGRAAKLVFQVAGCVKCPGVYSLDEGKRVVDAVHVAGGPKANADLESINLAAKIQDGARIYIPPKGGAPPSAGLPIMIASGSSRGSASRSSRSGTGSASGKLSSPGEGIVSINTADSTELQRLPGVGPATAELIIDHRNRIGHFANVEQLMDVKGIGPKKLEKMRPFVGL